MTNSRKGLDGELIRDREVAVVAEDRLGHDSVVEQLEHLIRTVPTPTNIALYGAWGAGKSGIANLLRERVLQLPGVKFARFDAFKYAENPLRRNFVAAVASSLGINDKKFHDELYNGKVTNDFQLPLVGLCKLLMVFAGVAGGAIAISLLIMAIVSLLGDASFKVVFQRNISALFSASLVPASIMTVLFAIVGKVLVVERRSEKLASDEQFEEIFRQLVSNARLEKLVIFVDELDRCSPDNVVATLDAVRTFLGVEKCIFIVASDQQVLEKALTKSVQQATPLDKVNPYYSAGSAYLDKVFQYHISVPPLLPHSVTRYALGLVEKRVGVWGGINTAQIVSILVPSHVKSPRRVKNLLNSFALFYRLAESRQRAGFLQASLLSRAEEMAKLVCLNVEFPLFARDLLIDHRLPEYVLALFELGRPVEYAESEEDTGEEKFNEAVDAYWREQKYVSESVKDLAKEYAYSSMALAPLMISGIGNKSERNLKEEVERSQARQLIDYLSRTRRVTSPQKDLIHLQSAGNLFGLSAEVAAELESLAQNGAWQKIISIYEKLEFSSKKGALQFLLQQGRVAIGLEQENIVSCILAIASDGDVDISAEVDQLFDMVEIIVSKSRGLLNASTMKGAWRLSIMSSRAAADSLSRTILEYEELPKSVDLFVYILSRSDKAIQLSVDSIAAVFSYHLCSESPEDLMDEIGTVEEDKIAFVFSSISSRLCAALKKMATDYKSEVDAAAKAKTEIRADAVSPQNTINSLLGMLSRATTQDLREALLGVVLGVDHSDFRDGVEAELVRLGDFGSGSNIRLILRAARLRIQRELSGWIKLINKNALSSASCFREYSALMVAVVQFPGGLSETARASAVKAILSIWDSLSSSDQQEVRRVISELKLEVKEEGDVAKAEGSLTMLDEFSAAGSIDRDLVKKISINMLVASLEEDLTERDGASAILKFISNRLERLLRERGSSGLDVSEDEQSRLIEALGDCSWMPDAIHRVVLLRCLANVSDSVLQANSEAVPNYEELSSLISDQGLDAESVLAPWISISHASAADLLEPIGLAMKKLDESTLSDALLRWVEKASSEDRQALFEGIVSDPTYAALGENLLRVLGAKQLDEEVVCAAIISRYKAASTKQQKVEALRVWKRVGSLGSNAKRQIIDSVFIPALQDGGVVSREAVESFAILCAPVPKVIKKRLGELISVSAEREGIERNRVYEILKSANYRIKKRFFAKDVIESD